MKILLLLPATLLPLFLTGCETLVVDRRPARSVYVERDSDRTPYSTVNRVQRVDRYDGRYDNRYDRYENRVDRYEDRRPERRDVVVVNPRPAYTPRVEVRYYNDTRGRYYIQGGRRVYVNSGVRY